MLMNQEYNPFAAKCHELEVALNLAKAGLQDIRAKLAWHSQFGVRATKQMQTTLLATASKAMQMLQADLPEVERLQRRRVRMESQPDFPRVQPSGPGIVEGVAKMLGMAWVAVEERRREQARQILAEHRALMEQEAIAQGQCDALKRKVDDAHAQAKRLQEELVAYKAFDLAAAQQEEVELSQCVATLEASYERANTERAQFDRDYAEPMRELTHKQGERQKILITLSNAKALDARFGLASTPRDRAMLHEECRSRFGVDSPRKVIHDSELKLRGIDRAIQKLEQRLSATAKRESRGIKRLVIDGNNLCYEEQTFLGLAPLKALVPRLADAHEVILVFDSDIRSLVRMNDAEIKSQFPKTVRVHVMTHGKKADEQVLDQASNDGHWVLSNDGFQEFPEKPVVKAGRFLRHSIFNGRVAVEDLGVSLAFDPAG
ncbi:hypothetical protein [Dyella sp. 2RAB6]|uniref:hypothetical protein n=1 Tax=Dyella sp. 2RAB6 TaxID=3232992 RepID=UPI003F90898D